VISRLRIGTLDDALLAVEIVDLNGDPLGGLAPTATITAPSGATLTLPGAGALGAVTGLTGFYRLTVPAANFSEGGLHAIVYAPNSASAAPVAGAAVNRLSALTRVGLDTGRLTIGLFEDLDLWVWISDLAGAGLGGLTPTLLLRAPDLSAVSLPSSTLSPVAGVTGLYRLTVSRTVLTQTGGYFARVDPVSAAAARVPADVVMRVDPLAATGQPVGQTREGAYENLRATIATVVGMKSAIRGPQSFDEVAPDGYPYSIIVDAADEKPQEGFARVFPLLARGQIEVHTRGLTATQLEALYLDVWKAIMVDPTRGGAASNTAVGDYTPVDYLPEHQGFVLSVRMLLTKVNLD